MSLKTFLLKTFTWWNGSTFGTDFAIRRMGEKVGADEFGNTYYRAKGGQKDKALGYERRWVVYNGEAEASSVPPGWAGWLSHTYPTPPTEESYAAREWHKPHVPNLTGTPGAYRPSGSALSDGTRQPTGGDYKPWTPGA
jgi:NADH:ubiquinone oxidoreductase subunit